nr:winged helix-turn-helix domain-containing protein [Streptomyces aquilus]
MRSHALHEIPRDRSWQQQTARENHGDDQHRSSRGTVSDGQKNREIAAALRVNERSVERWRRQWRERGEAGALSKGSSGRPRLNEKQNARLARELEREPLVHGWADQRWTLARSKTLIGRLFHVSYTVEGTWLLPRRHGWSWQQPARRAIERDDQAVEVWKKETWSLVRAPRRRATAGSSSRTGPASR